MKKWPVIILFLFSIASAKPEPCKDVFWGAVEYVDEGLNGQLVRKTDVFTVEEWSDQQQFDTLLIEKNRSLLLMSSAAVKVGISLSGASEKKYSVRDWKGNSSFFEVVGFQSKSSISKLGPIESQMSISYSVDGTKSCQKVIPIRTAD